MRLNDALKAISLVFKKSSDRLTTIKMTKENLSAMIEDNRSMLSIIDATIFSFDTTQQKVIFNKALASINSNREVRRYISHGTLDFIAKMPSKLQGKARSFDPSPLGAIAQTSIIMNKFLEDLASNMDAIMEKNESITINNTKISQGILVGAIEAASIYCNFVTYLFATMSNIITGKNLDTTPKYIYEYIDKHGDTFINIVNQLCNMTGRYSVINDITNLRNKGVDFKFTANEEVGAVNVSKFIGDVIDIENIFITVFSLMFRPFSFFGEIYVDIRHDHYARMKERKAWLESHVALLLMDMENEDKNSERYTRLVKVIEYYTEQLSKYDKKLSKYYEE